MNGLVFHLLCYNVVGLCKEARQTFGSQLAQGILTFQMFMRDLAFKVSVLNASARRSHFTTFRHLLSVKTSKSDFETFHSLTNKVGTQRNSKPLKNETERFVKFVENFARPMVFAEPFTTP